MQPVQYLPDDLSPISDGDTVEMPALRCSSSGRAATAPLDGELGRDDHLPGLVELIVIRV